MMIGPAFVIFALCTAAFIWAQRQRHRLALWVRSVTLFLMMAGLFGLGALSPFREALSVHLTALGADPKVPAEDALIVGDHHDYADFVVTPYAADAPVKPATDAHHDFVVVSTLAHKVTLRTAPGDPASGRPAMVVAWREKGKALRFDGAIALGQTASLCPDAACKTPVPFDAAHWRESLAATGETLSGHRPAYYQRVFRPRGFEGKQSAVFSADGRWYLLPLDPGVHVAGGHVTEGLAVKTGSTADLAPGRPISLSIFRLDVPDSDLNAPVRMVSRQTLTVSDSGHGVFLKPRSALVAAAGTCVHPRLTLARLSATSRTTDYGTPDKILTFATLGNGSLRDDGSYRATSPMNRADDGPLLGGAASLCDFKGRDFSITGQRLTVIKASARDDAALTFSVQGMRIPWVLLAFAVFGLVLTERFGARGDDGRRSEYVLIGLLQYLLALRLLIGVRGTLMDPQIVPSDVFSDVASAFIGLPVALIALRSLADLPVKPRLILAGATTAAFALIFLWTGSLDRPFLAVMVITFAALAWPAFPVKPVVTALQGFNPLPHISRVTNALKRHDLPVLAIGLITTAMGLRLAAFWLFGIQERAGIAMSLPYLALILPGFALYLAHVGKSAVKFLLQAIVFGGLVIAAVVIVPSLTRDHGFAIIQTFPILALAFVEAARWRLTPKWVKPLWMAGLPGAVVAFTALLAVFNYAHGLPPGEGTLLSGIDYALKFDSNDIRMLHQFHGDLVTGFGTRAAVSNTQFWLDLGTFTATLTGQGYLTDQTLGAFGYQALHFSDNLSAVHLMHPFGRIGAALFLAALVYSLSPALGNRDATASEGGWLTARLALWTVIFVAAYMILANLGWVPFTGRNIYLLAVSSGSDIAEGFMLLAMATIGLKLRRQAS